MNEYRCKGTITVFLSLISVLFLSLLCTTIESARIQGCRAKAAAALDMGLFSIFGEFEKELLERYDVFFLDGAGGTGKFSTDSICEKLQDYMEYNVSPNKGHLLKGYDPFGLRMTGAQVTGVQLATDEKGGAFYQQAVGFMKENLGTEMVSSLLERAKDAKKMEEAGNLYKEREKTIGEQLKQMEEEQKRQEEEKQKIWEEQRKNAEARGDILPEQPKSEPQKVPASENPLNVIRKIKRKSLMDLVLGEKEISGKTLPGNSPSRRICRKGTLPVEKKHSGVTADLLFQEYLFGRFSLFTDEKKEGVLDYELEYILCGKTSDEKNLKSIVNRLLLMREGSNFLYLTNDLAKKSEVQAMAALLTGWIPVPGITAVTAYALLLAWAYAESLLDVRELLAGGKVPLFKEADNWRVSLEGIPKLLDLLEGTDGSCREGISYEGYLQILFTLGNKKKYPMRALDLIEGYLQSTSGMSDFRADCAVSKIAAKAEFVIPPVFLKVSNAYLKTGITQQSYEAAGSFAY